MKITKKDAVKLLQNRKVYVSGKSETIQKKLFELGFSWSSHCVHAGCEKQVDNLDYPFLFIRTDKFFYGINMKDFLKHEYREIFADEICEMNFIGETKCSFKPFDKILVRDKDSDSWKPDFFERFHDGSEYPFVTINNVSWKQCIPYEGNECLTNKVSNERIQLEGS